MFLVSYRYKPARRFPNLVYQELLHRVQVLTLINENNVILRECEGWEVFTEVKHIAKIYHGTVLQLPVIGVEDVHALLNVQAMLWSRQYVVLSSDLG